MLKTNSQGPKKTSYFEGVLHFLKMLLFPSSHSTRFHVVVPVIFRAKHMAREQNSHGPQKAWRQHHGIYRFT